MPSLPEYLNPRAAGPAPMSGGLSETRKLEAQIRRQGAGALERAPLHSGQHLHLISPSCAIL